MNISKLALFSSIGLAVFSFALMKVMYIIDPLSYDGGYVTTFVFIFINVPLWIISTIVFLYAIYLFLRGKNKRLNYEEQEEGEHKEDIE